MIRKELLCQDFSHGLHAPVHEENGSRQPRQAVLVALVIQTLSLL